MFGGLWTFWGGDLAPKSPHFAPMTADQLELLTSLLLGTN